MQGRSIIRSIAVCFVLAIASSLGLNCSSNSAAPTGGDGGLVVQPSDMGLCRPTCTKDCLVDQDCQLSNGELCCDLGPAGHTCLKASLCPRFCSDDSKCDISTGQACVRATLSTPQKVCTQPVKGLSLCAMDADCKTSDVCCQNYKEPICLT